MTENPSTDSGQDAPGGAGVPPPSPAAPPEPTGEPHLVGPESSDAKTMAMLCHLLAIFTYWIGPLIIWLVKKDQSPFVNQQGKEALNFELTLMIGVVAGVATICIAVGGIILAAVSVVNIVFGILSTIAVNRGEPYRYPVCIRFIK